MATTTISPVLPFTDSSTWTLAGRDLGGLLLQSVNAELDKYGRHTIEKYVVTHFCSFMSCAHQSEHQVFVARKINTQLPITLRFCASDEKGGPFSIQFMLKTASVEATRKVFKRVIITCNNRSQVFAEIGVKKRDAEGRNLSLEDIERSQKILDDGISLISELSSKVHFLPTYVCTKFIDKNGLVRMKYLARLGVDLGVYISANDKSECFYEKLRIATELTLFLHELHTQGLCHLALKLEKVILLPNGTLFVSDLGLAAPCGKEIPSCALTQISAPESLSGKTFTATQALDLWSLGLIFYRLFSCSEDPFLEIQDKTVDYSNLKSITSYQEKLLKIIEKVCGHLESQLGSLNTIIRKLLSPVPHERPSSKEVLDCLHALKTAHDINY